MKTLMVNLQPNRWPQCAWNSRTWCSFIVPATSSDWPTRSTRDSDNSDKTKRRRSCILQSSRRSNVDSLDISEVFEAPLKPSCLCLASRRVGMLYFPNGLSTSCDCTVCLSDLVRMVSMRRVSRFLPWLPELLVGLDWFLTITATRVEVEVSAARILNSRL